MPEPAIGEYYLGVDIGTSAVKVVLLDDNDKIAGVETEEYAVSMPHSGWSEQEPEDWWIGTKRAVAKLVADTGIDSGGIKCIGVSGQMVGLVVLDAQKNALRPCILWNDQRSAREAKEFTEKVGVPFLLEHTGNLAFASFLAPKLLWLRNHEPDVYGRIAHIMLPKDYIVFKLTGEISTEVSDASGTCLFDVEKRTWSAPMIEAFGVSADWLPPCRESGEIVGTVQPKAAAQISVPRSTTVVAGAGDQPAQALGSGITAPGLCSVSIGTSGVVFAQGESYKIHPKGILHMFCHSIPGQWYLMGVMLSAGGSFQWLRNLLGGLKPITYEELGMLAQAAPEGSRGLLFLPYLSGERCPYDDPEASGGWIGIQSHHTIEDIVRSVVEGISFGLKDSLTLIEQTGFSIARIFASGGATKSPFWLQLLADVFGKELVTTSLSEGAALGAAMLAAVGFGKYRDLQEASAKLITIRDSYIPRPEYVKRYENAYGVFSRQYGRLKDSFTELAGLRRECNC